MSDATRSKRGLVVASALSLLALGALGAVIARADSVATGRALDALAERGITCDEATFAVDVSVWLDRATVAPTRCEVRRGPIASVDVLEPIDVELSSLEPAHMHVPSMRFELRDEVARPDMRMGPMLEALEIPQRIAALTAGLARLSEQHPPRTSVARAEIARGSDVLVQLAAIELTPGDEGLGVSAERAALPVVAMLGARAEVALEGLHATARADEVQLAGVLAVDASVPLLGAMRQRNTVSVTARALDTDRPTWDVSVAPVEADDAPAAP